MGGKEEGLVRESKNKRERDSGRCCGLKECLTVIKALSVPVAFLVWFLSAGQDSQESSIGFSCLRLA
jgi:hypothetical protein